MEAIHSSETLVHRRSIQRHIPEDGIFRSSLDLNICVWNNAKDENKTRKGTFYKVTAGFVFMCGSENWALNRSERREIEAADMRFLRHVSGCVLTDHVHSIISNALQIYA
jgi:hypothetical protein